MHEVLVSRLGGLNLPRKSVVRITDRPDMTLDVYRGHKTIQQQQQHEWSFHVKFMKFDKGSFLKFHMNDHEYKILFIFRFFKIGFYRLQNEHYFNKKPHC